MKENQDEIISNAINLLTEKMSEVLLQEFLKLPADQQLNIVLIKSAHLLLANILCNIASNNEELEKIISAQGEDIKELTHTCAISAFADKFKISAH
jgi:hypothetical protein